MKTTQVKIHCNVCGKFNITRPIETNEYGYFELPEAYCPYCFSILIQILDNEDKQEWQKK